MELVVMTISSLVSPAILLVIKKNIKDRDILSEKRNHYNSKEYRACSKLMRGTAKALIQQVKAYKGQHVNGGLEEAVKEVKQAILELDDVHREIADEVRIGQL